MVELTTPAPDGTPIGEMIDGKFYGRNLLADTNGADAMGLVAAAPAANTLLGRLKAIVDGVAAAATTIVNAVTVTASADTIFTITPSDTVPLSTIPKALRVTAAGNLAIRGTGSSPVTIPVVANETLPIRARYIYATGTTATVVGLA